MLNDTGIRKYLDLGSLHLFAVQLVEGLPNAVTVAVFNNNGERAWCGPGADDADLWQHVRVPDVAAVGIDACIELNRNRVAYQFVLRQLDAADPMGYLLVMAGGEQRIPVNKARRDVADILDCILKQLGIRLELSAVRRQTGRERHDMQLLAQLDSLRSSGNHERAMQASLRIVAEHFDSALAIMSIPGRELHKAWRTDGDVSARNCQALRPIFDSLVAAAQKRRRVLIADAGGPLARFALIDEGAASILSSPILDDSDEVAGVLGLVSSRKFSRFDVRLARVVAAKIAMLADAPENAAAGLCNRHDLLREMNLHLQNDPSTSRALLVIDIDKLHVVNEMHGHFAGDAAIAAVLAVATKAGGDTGIACDISGGSIALYLPESNERDAIACADRVRDTLRTSPTVYEGREIELLASIGIAMMPAAVQDAETALNTAEVASRSAKARGGDQSVVFDDLDASVMRRREDLNQVGRLQAALLDNRFVLYGQQIVPLHGDDNRPRFEILLRMLDEKGNILAPDRFLSAAERYQMMSSIDRWVFRETTRMLSETENQLEISLASFSVNVSTQSMMDDEFTNFVEQRIVDSGIAADTFCFEITETSVMRNLQRAQQLLHRLQKLGCRLALDDFGTGQCSFAYLKDIPVQYIKIDGTFVRDIVDNPLSLAIVESVGKIANVINAHTVAEYVENDSILECLREAGIDFAQGYRIGKPRPLAGILAEFGTATVGEAELLGATA
jgi:diguanylate cyclase (GGDEF)-like protein